MRTRSFSWILLAVTGASVAFGVLLGGCLTKRRKNRLYPGIDRPAVSALLLRLKL